MEEIAPNLTTEGQYDQALKIAATIKDDSAKQRAMEAIAPNLTTEGQYDQALKIAETIKMTLPNRGQWKRSLPN
jgi:Flp pilus assembly protein TadD